MRNIANFSREQAIAIETIRHVPEWAQQASITGAAICDRRVDGDLQEPGCLRLGGQEAFLSGEIPMGLVRMP